MVEKIAKERHKLELGFQALADNLGDVPIASNILMPYGWRKAKKGRTVWRILEEIISQNLEKDAKKYGFHKVIPATSEVGVFDFIVYLDEETKCYVNIKSSVKGGRTNKDDISKAPKLIEYYKNHVESLFVATFIIDFKKDMTIDVERAIVMPVSWIPDVYVNPSNNGNLQSSKYKNLDVAIKRTNSEFLQLLVQELIIADEKRKRKRDKVE
ncbi:hypothetical protein [Liberiplasma polymorphum]|uniref:hypothetical protein n=1 Tax=Liberiplasma polymorphum TaxID=3374570 RepID=UPI00377513BD